MATVEIMNLGEVCDASGEMHDVRLVGKRERNGMTEYVFKCARCGGTAYIPERFAKRELSKVGKDAGWLAEEEKRRAASLAKLREKSAKEQADHEEKVRMLKARGMLNRSRKKQKELEIEFA